MVKVFRKQENSPQPITGFQEQDGLCMAALLYTPSTCELINCLQGSKLLAGDVLENENAEDAPTMLKPFPTFFTNALTHTWPSHTHGPRIQRHDSIARLIADKCKERG